MTNFRKNTNWLVQFSVAGHTIDKYVNTQDAMLKPYTYKMPDCLNKAPKRMKTAPAQPNNLAGKGGLSIIA